jgi:hypothetical protein
MMFCASSVIWVFSLRSGCQQCKPRGNEIAVLLTN